MVIHYADFDHVPLFCRRCELQLEFSRNSLPFGHDEFRFYAHRVANGGHPLKQWSLHKVVILIVLAVLSMVALIGINEIGYQRSSTALGKINEAAKTRSELHRLMQQVLDAETGSRG
jgi:hypothetical protein